jgi:hypothetical protein
LRKDSIRNFVFITGVFYTSDKLFTGNDDTGNNLSPVTNNTNNTGDEIVRTIFSVPTSHCGYHVKNKHFSVNSNPAASEN